MKKNYWQELFLYFLFPNFLFIFYYFNYNETYNPIRSLVSKYIYLNIHINIYNK